MKTSVAIIAVVLLVILGASVMWGRQLDQEIEFYAPDENQLILIAEEAKPRFVGEIGGIYIVPDERLVEELVPEGYVTYGRLCGDSYSTTATFEEAGELDFDIDLPATYVLQLDDMNTGAVACNGIVYAARRAYTYQLPDGGEAYFVVGRSILSYDTQSFASDRLRTISIDGRRVVLVEPLTADGSVGNGYAWIPESKGKEFLMTSGLPRRQFGEVVAAMIQMGNQ